MPNNTIIDKPLFVVTKRIFKYRWCSSCNGVGSKSRTFRGSKYVVPCVTCKGTGREKYTHETEVSLIEALKELKLIK